MKKIFMTISTGATLSVAIMLGSCNNAEQVKKQNDGQNAKIQSMADDKLNGLQDQVNKECTAMVDSVAGVKFNEWKEEEAKHKGGHKPKPKETPKPKEKPKAETPKPVNPKDNKMNGGKQNNTEDKNDKMSGKTQSNTDAKNKKMGGGK